MNNKKIIIIGGGISGLTAGIYSQKAGFKSEIYEKNAIVGGECTGWNRSGYYIDNCIHWLMGTTNGSALHKIWEDIGAIGNGIEIIKNDAMYRSELNGESITLWSDIEKTKEEMLKLSPDDEMEILSLIKYIKMAENVEIPAEKPSELMNPLELIKLASKSKKSLAIFKAYEGMDTNDLMNKFKHPLIKCLISDFTPSDSRASSFPMAYGNFVSGDGGLPRGGSRAMSLRIGKKYEELGGKIFTNRSSVKINIEGGKAVSVTLEDGTTVNGDYVICACDTDYTFNHLIDKSYMPPLMKQMYENRKAYPVYGMFQTAFAVDSSIDEIGIETMMDFSDSRFASWIKGRITVKSFSYEPSFAPEGKQIIQVLLSLTEDSYDYWKELYNDKSEYNRKKNEYALIIMKKLEERYPAYKGKMSILDIWTPMTYKRYCNAYKGYNQSFMITKYSSKLPYPPATIKGLDNVLLSGQWINPPGGLPGAAITGKFSVQRILKKERQKIDIL